MTTHGRQVAIWKTHLAVSVRPQDPLVTNRWRPDLPLAPEGPSFRKVYINKLENNKPTLRIRLQIGLTFPKLTLPHPTKYSSLKHPVSFPITAHEYICNPHKNRTGFYTWIRNWSTAKYWDKTRMYTGHLLPRSVTFWYRTDPYLLLTDPAPASCSFRKS